jgi:hypothetical protein
MAVGTAFTLFFVPAIYLLIARDRHGERAHDASPTVAVPPPAVPAPT